MKAFDFGHDFWDGNVLCLFSIKVRKREVILAISFKIVLFYSVFYSVHWQNA